MNVVAKEVVIPLVTPYMSDGLDAFWQSIKSWFVDYLWHLLKIQLWASLDWFSVVLIAVQGLLTLYLMLDKKHLAAFTARKIMHCGSGLILMLLNTDCLVIRLVIYAKCVIGLIMNWELLPRALPDFWFAVPDDLGITIYLLVVLIWVWMGHRLRVLAPVFLADPAGAIFGCQPVLPNGQHQGVRRENSFWIPGRFSGHICHPVGTNRHHSPHLGVLPRHPCRDVWWQL